MSDGLLWFVFGVIGLAMIYASPFIAFWDLGAAVMFLVVGAGTFVGLLLSQE